MTAPRPTLRRERALFAGGAGLVAGMDEVGRGAFAGPVSVGVVVVTTTTPPAPRGLADSKLLTPQQREALCEPLRRWALAHAVGHASAREVDIWGLTAALRLAGLRALATARQSLAAEIDVVLLDGAHNWLRPAPCAVETAIKADQRMSSVAAASVLAKVTRDALMVELAASYPQYGFDRHKGYGTAEHRAAITQHGPCLEHRQTWLHDEASAAAA